MNTAFAFMTDLWHAKIAHSLDLFRLVADMGQPLNLYHSGGKDSVVIDALAKMAGVKCRRIYHVTTIDPPELVRFVRSCGGVEMLHPGTSFFKLVAENGLPTRWRRWCCEKLKHGRSLEGISIVGVRAAESAARKRAWKELEMKDQRLVLCPILGWSDDDVWRFIRENNLAYCSLYDHGFKRIGCIGCPLAGCPERELNHYPRIKELIHRAWVKYSETHTVDDVERAWAGWLATGKLYGETEPEDECQMNFLMT